MLQPGHYEIIRKGDKKEVNLGSTVKLEFMDTREVESYIIVGSTEADPLKGKISNDSPLAAAILGAKAGDVREVNVRNPYKVTVISID